MRELADPGALPDEGADYVADPDGMLRDPLVQAIDVCAACSATAGFAGLAGIRPR